MTRGSSTTEDVVVTDPDAATEADPIAVAPEETEPESEERENERLRAENSRLATEVHGLRAIVEGVGNPGEELQAEEDADPRIGVEAIFRGATGHNPDPDDDADKDA